MVRAFIFDCTGVLTTANGAVNLPLLAYIRHQLKPRFRVGMLTNLSSGSIGRAFSPADLLLFDSVTTASETGVAKPDPRAYSLAAERLDVRPDECVFIDDFERRCEAAREQGMQVVLYDNVDQARRELDAIIQEA